MSIPLIHLSGRSIRANMMLDEGVLAFIDSEPNRRNISRTPYAEWMARRIARAGGVTCLIASMPGLRTTI